MNVLVIGGAGYVGSHVARHLQRAGYGVAIFDNLSTGHASLASGFRVVQGDVRDQAALRAALTGVDAVLHFAAHAYVGESVENPRKYFDNNVRGGLALLDAMLDAGVRTIVFSSSCAVYGIPRSVPISERERRRPVSPYGRSKLFFEWALEDYARAYGLQYAALRYFNAAGADASGEIGEMHQPETHLIPLALAAVARRGPPLSVFGKDYSTPDGTCVRDYVHVIDLADAHVRALNDLAAGGESFAANLGTGRGHSVLEVIAAAGRATGADVPHQFVARRLGDPAALVADPQFAQARLGWKATLSLDDCVSSAWRWMQRKSAS